MKLTWSIFLGVLLMFATLSFDGALATVGGPIYVSRIAYSPVVNSVYYLSNRNDGMGCPPIIHQISLKDGQDVEVMSCRQVFQEYYSGDANNGEQKYNKFLTDYYKKLRSIGSISLKKNNIDIEVEALSERVENGEKYWTDFQAVVTQLGKEVKRVSFQGCDKDQPHIFEGYRIPGSDKMALLISTKGDCFEGGYASETIRLIEGINYRDTESVRGVKEAVMSEPSEANLVVFAPNRNKATQWSTTLLGIIGGHGVLLIAVGGVLVAGLLVGFVVRKRRNVV